VPRFKVWILIGVLGWSRLGPAVSLSLAADTTAKDASPASVEKLQPKKSQQSQKKENDSIEIQDKLDKISTLKEKGQYQEAAQMDEKLLKSGKLPRAQRKRIRREYEKLNEKLMFSRTITPESTLHTVVEGESLYTIARKYGTTSALIRRMNGLEKETIYPGMKLKVVTGTFFIRVDKSQNTLRLFLNDKPMKTYQVATGRDNSTPTGDFTVVTKLKNPTWYKPGAVIEPGSPDNHLGTRWLGFDQPGYGIHGTTQPKLIGQQVSHGCVRMLNEDVEELYDIVPQGIKGTIT